MRNVLIAIIVALTFTCHAQEPSNNFFHAINMVETGGRTGYILGDHSRSLGPLQISYAYWKDSGMIGKYSSCADYGYSCKVMTAYLNRYGSRFIIERDYESLARIHNGGPKGYQNPATKEYWKKVKKQLTNQQISAKITP